MEESAVYLKYSGQGFAHDAIALWVLVKCDRCFRSSSLLDRKCCFDSLQIYLMIAWGLDYKDQPKDVGFPTADPSYDD